MSGAQTVTPKSASPYTYTYMHMWVSIHTYTYKRLHSMQSISNEYATHLNTNMHPQVSHIDSCLEVIPLHLQSVFRTGGQEGSQREPTYMHEVQVDISGITY